MSCQPSSILHRLVYIFAGCFLVACIDGCKQNNAAAAAADKKPSPVADSVNPKALLEISQAKKLLKDAALVTRSDNDFESLTLQNFSKREQSYSHSGVAFLEDGQYVVYHSMTGHENPDGLCRRDPFDSFVNPAGKTGLGIFQYQLSDPEKERLHHIMKTNYSTKLPFDLVFNLKTNDSMYCSEMIFKGLKAATNGRVVLPSSYIKNFKPKIMGYKASSTFFKQFEYIGIDDLYLNPFCKEVIRVKY